MIMLRSRVSRVDAVAFSPDGSQVAVGGTNGVELWSTCDLSQIWRWQDPSGLRFIRNIYFGSHGVLVVASQPGYPLMLFDAQTSRHAEIRFPYSDDRPQRLSWDAVAEQLVVASGARVSCWRFVRLNNPPDGDFPIRREVVWDTPLVLSSQGHFVRRDGCAEDAGPTLWMLSHHFWQTLRADTGELRRGYRTACTKTDELVDAPEVQFIIGRGKEVLTVFPYEDLKNPWRITKETNNHYTGMALHPTGIYLATTSNDRVVRLWDLRRWRTVRDPSQLRVPQQAVRTYEWKAGRMRSIAFSPDGLFAAAGGELGEFVLFDTEL